MRPVATTRRAHPVLRLAAAAPLAAVLEIAPVATPCSTTALIPAASAACPDAEVVFARGREEPPGVGAVGDALVNSLRSKVRVSVGVYGVNYPADLSAASGANDIRAHMQSMASSCPNT
ncbi:MAG: cutinase family protein, partial [Mycobacteriaceae bacterium]|nr:cutinase family protein [Mycobacteriaceae bacterium]